jgi:leader peptidase (prepilin peptidase)/N-methyltransferase
MSNTDLAALVLICTPFVAFFGACMGSFLNVCIYRIPLGLSVIHPRSRCCSCERPIPWYLNLPVLSWILLRGKCRYCQAPIAFRYLLVELLTALLFLVVWMQYASALLQPDLANLWKPDAMLAAAPTRGVLLQLVPLSTHWLVPVYWLALFGLLLGTFVDLEHYILPNRVTIGGMILGLALSPLVPLMHNTLDPLTALMRSGIGCGVGFGSLWLIATLGSLAFRKEAMGFGDVKLMGAVGAFLGWKAVLFTIICSSFLGSIVGVALIVSGKRQLQGRIPYGPFIAAAAVIWIFWGPLLFNLYARLLLPAQALS